MYYRLGEDGNILDFCGIKYHEDCLYTDKEIVFGYDGIAYIKGTEPEEPKDVKQARITSEMEAVVVRHLDNKAQGFGYDSCGVACTYVDTGVPRYDSEGLAFRAWRSAVWATFYDILAEVFAGERTMPSEDELIDALPEFTISYK